MNLYSTNGPDERLNLMRIRILPWVMVSKPHLIRDNPLLQDFEGIGRKDPEYFNIIMP